MRTLIPIPSLTDAETAQFWSRVDKAGACWLWTGAVNTRGYGRFSLRKKSFLATRVAWALENRQSPTLCILHRCDNPACVNPAHLWEGTDLDNMRDMTRKGRHWAASRDRCSAGHPYSPENTYLHKGARQCRRCNAEAARRYSARRAAA